MEFTGIFLQIEEFELRPRVIPLYDFSRFGISLGGIVP